MKFYHAVQKVAISDSILTKAKQFAKEVVATTNYSDANQTQVDKIINDHFISKLGEEAVKMVMSRFAEVKGPDYEIYGAKQKSWDADLFIDGLALAVKTQTTSAAIRYGLSWTFQNGIKRKDIILLQPEAWVAFVEYDDTHEPYQTCFVLPPFQIKKLTFDEPKLAHLKDHKKVVYATSLGKWRLKNWNKTLK